MNRGLVLLPSCAVLANLFLNFYFWFVFDWFTRFYAVKIIENIDTQSSSWSESLKRFSFGDFESMRKDASDFAKDTSMVTRIIARFRKTLI